MKRLPVIFILALTALPARAFDISEDGHETTQPSIHPGGVKIITDEVPLPTSPDYSLNLRMQVGGLAFGDFDNDGDLDLAAGCYHSQSYPPYNDWRNFVLRNSDGQLESSPSWWSTDSRSTSDVKWADFDSNGYLDLFAANGDFTLDANVIYFGTENGLSNAPGWLASDQTWTTSCDPADFDNDGDIDMATANQGVYPDYNRPVYIYINSGNGLPTTPEWQSDDQMLSSFISWGDMNNDGWYDLAVSKWVNFESCVYPNNEGVMQRTPGWTSGSTRSDKGIGWGDVDSDSFPELAIGGTEPTLLFDNVDGILGNTPIWQSNNPYHGCQDLAWADIDNDGDPDLATVEFSNGQVRIYLNVDGVLESTPSWVYDADGAGTALAFGDVNGDGLLDLAMGQSGQPCILLFLNNSEVSVDEKAPRPGEFALKQNYPNPFNATTRIDFEVTAAGWISLDVYDILGNMVANIASGEYVSGSYSTTWDATGMASGIYFCKFQRNGKSIVKRMALEK